MTECNACGSTIDIGCRAVFVHDGKEDLIFCDNNECMRDYYRRNPTIDMEMDGETAGMHMSRLNRQHDIHFGLYDEEESLKDIELSALTVRDLI